MFRIISNYNHSLHERPFLTKSLTSAVLFFTGDVVNQTLIFKKKLSEVDFVRSSKLAFYGFSVTAPLLHTWHCKIIPYATPLVLKRIFSIDKPSKFSFALTSIALDGMTLMPLMTFFFFEGTYFLFNWSFKGALKHTEGKYWNTLKMGYLYWPVVAFFNFMFIPLQFRVLYSNFFGFFWNIYLSHASRQNPQFAMVVRR